MLRPLEASSFPVALALLCEGFPERSPAFWEAGLQRLQKHGGNHEAGYPFGFLLMEGEKAVGIALTPASLRHQGDGNRQTVVNMSSWYVQPAHRWRAGIMLKTIFADKSVVFTDLTPTEDVQKMLPVFGFRAVNKGILFHALPFALFGSWSARVSLLQETVALPSSSLSSGTVQAHRHLGCRMLRMEGSAGPQLVIYRPIRHRGVPGAHLIYAESDAALAAGFGALARHLLAQGLLFLITDCRDEAASRAWNFRPRGIWFARPDIFEDRTDFVGSELCILDL